MSTHFVEIQDKAIVSEGHVDFKYMDEYFDNIDKSSLKPTSYAVLYLGHCAPGGNNIIDGLLKYKQFKRNTTLLGFVNGTEGVKKDCLQVIDEESFAPYRNMGGYDFLGRDQEVLDPADFPKVAESCKRHNIDGLILVGATKTLTDTAKLSEYFLQNQVPTNVVCCPATLDGNIRHGYLQTTLGFNTATKVYSQLIGNILTDSASNFKYWYFIRLMGNRPSHLAMECAL